MAPSHDIARLAPHAALAPLHVGFSFYNPVGRGALAPWRQSGARRGPSRTAALTLGAVVPLVRRESHHRLVYLGGNSQRAIERLFRPFPRDRMRLCCRWRL